MDVKVPANAVDWGKGPYVPLSDFARLAAENERLRGEVKSLTLQRDAAERQLNKQEARRLEPKEDIYEGDLP